LREAIRLKPDYPGAHYNLGVILNKQGRRKEEEAAYREALRLKPDYPGAHYNLGNALFGQGRYREAEAAFREASRLKPDHAEAHCNLGCLLQKQGRFSEALQSLKRGHALGSPRPGWSHPSEQWVREANQFVALDAQLPKFLSSQGRPPSPGDGIALARLCQLKKLQAAAARFYAVAFSGEPRLREKLGVQGSRYSAACAAALAGCGKGKDAAEVTPMQRLHWRRQALTWLRVDLNAWRRLLEKGPEKARPEIIKQMRHWLADSDFAGVREQQALAKLPETERPGWQKLWTDVAGLLARSEGTARPERKPDPK
jgi:tetratricopeptide (TPR) repeat protein